MIEVSILKFVLFGMATFAFGFCVCAFEKE